MIIKRVEMAKEFRERFGLRLRDAVILTDMVIDKLSEFEYLNAREEKLRKLAMRRDLQIMGFQREANVEIKNGNVEMAQHFLLLIEQAEEDFRLAVERMD